KPVKLDFVGRDLAGPEDERGRRQRSLGGRAGASHNIREILLTLFFLGLGHLGFYQVVGVHQVGKIGFGGTRSGVLLSRQAAEKNHTNQTDSREHQYDFTTETDATRNQTSEIRFSLGYFRRTGFHPLQPGFNGGQSPVELALLDGLVKNIAALAAEVRGKVLAE